MTKLTIGIVDYGIGNHASVRHCLHDLGLRCRVSDDPSILEACDLLLLPGVGAFRPAMLALQEKALDRFLLDQAGKHRPILGICLGMQLLTQASHEDGYTRGLGLIPGEVVSLSGELSWHIGWNTLEQLKEDPLFQNAVGQTFYFNHSYIYQGPSEFQVCSTRSGKVFAAVIRRGKIVGVQFHPEKSQAVGRVLFGQLLKGLCNA